MNLDDSRLEELLPVTEQACECFRQAALTYLATCLTEGIPAEQSFAGLYIALMLYTRRMEVMFDALQASGSPDEALWLLGLQGTGEEWRKEFEAKIREVKGL